MAKAQAAVADDVEAPTPEPTLRETIEAARDEALARQEPEAPAEPAAGAQLEPAAAEGRTGRDASGRFAPKESAPAAAAASTVTPSAAAPAAAPAAAQPSTLAPQFWTAQGKAIWKDVPEAARQEILRREREAAQQASRFDDERQLAKQFSEITGKHQAIVARTGQHPLQVYEGFLGIMSVLQGNDPASKAALIRDVALRNGIDLRALAGAAPPHSPPGQAPAPAAPAPALPPEIVQSAREWQEHKAKLQREQEVQARQEQERVLQDIAEFRAKPEAEFFDAVKDQMIAMLNAGTAQTLDEAYNAAIWTRPDIRQVLLDRQSAAASTAAKQAEAARRARLKGGSIRGGSGSSPDGAPQDRTLRQELQANFAEARARL